jgi:hypothetical protein
VKDASQLAPGTEMTARLSKGRVRATVKETIRE